MILPLIAFFLLYGSLHLYVFVKVTDALVLGPALSLILAAFMGIMVAAPLLVRISTSRGLSLLARAISHIGYTWMGLAFLFFSFSLLVDLFRLTLHGTGLLLHRDFSPFIHSHRLTFTLPLLVTLAIASYGCLEARNIRNETLTIQSPKIPRESGGMTIVALSDIHLGLLAKRARLERILEQVKRAEPDILVSTGDLLDGQVDDLEGLAEPLGAIHPRYGKFAVTGNHEFYAGLDQAIDFTEKAGFTVLRGEAVTVDGVNIVGFDDPTGEHFGFVRGSSERELLSSLPEDKFTILLKHRPVVDAGALGLFDLQLSGHTHNGQIFPFVLITRLFFPVAAGLVRLAEGSLLYVSRGAGTWGPPIRFLSTPEITVIRLLHRSDERTGCRPEGKKGTC
ncbi:MAG: metallophosphoesterase [Deltaproteobacteria bacterium]|nr:metallophosphoesterase [Deltaproteobacteria bacterium]